MDYTALIHGVILGLVEGLTEFLPVSSTGHLILVGDLLGFNDEKGKLFEVFIQSGAILAVCWEYREKIFRVLRGLFTEKAAQRFAGNLAIAFIPTAVLGLLLGQTVKEHLFNPIVVATAFIVGAFVIIWAERRVHRIRVQEVDDLSWQDALKLGFAQTLALIPGTSRSGATIVGGLFFGLSRKAATEFSFFLAIPTLFAATGYDLYKTYGLLSMDDLHVFAAGFVTAFVSAFLAVRGLLKYIIRHDFIAFAWYRIFFGVAVLGTAHFGLVEWSQ